MEKLLVFHFCLDFHIAEKKIGCQAKAETTGIAGSHADSGKQMRITTF
jgi:hypothetical protein